MNTNRIHEDELNRSIFDEEQMKKTFLENGYDLHKITLFFHYLNNTMSTEDFQINKELIADMLYFLKTTDLWCIILRNWLEQQSLEQRGMD